MFITKADLQNLKSGGHEPFRSWRRVERSHLEAILRKKMNILFYLDAFRDILELKFATKTLQ